MTFLFLPTPIESFPFPFSPIPIPTLHSHSHFSHHLYSHFHPFPFLFPAATIMDYLKTEKYVYCVVNSKQNMKLQQKHCYSNLPLISHHHYNYHCLSLFTAQRLSDCHLMLLCKNSRLFTPVSYTHLTLPTNREV